MLANKQYTQGDIVTFKLSTSEELIARIVEDTMVDFKIVKPVVLVPTPNGSLGMVPALFSVELNTNSISLQKSSVVMHAATRKDVADEYLKGTTGIKPASSLLGVGNAQGSPQR
jgi:hypothetical protein